MTRFAVLGVGAVGGFLAAALHRSGLSVTAVSTELGASRIRSHGLHVTSETLGELLTHPPATDTLSEPVDVMFLATRAPELEAALQRLRAPVRLFVPLLSGIEHLTALRARFPESLTCAASIRLDATRTSPTEIRHRSKFAVIDSAFDDDWLSHRELRPLVEPLAGAGIALMVSAREVQVLWSKLVFLNSLSLVTALSGQSLGAIRTDPDWRSRMQSSLQEGAEVAQAEGARVSVEMTMEYVDHARHELSSKMLQDIRAGILPELDAISGAVLRAATRQRIPCPTIRELAAEVAARAGIPVPG